MIDQLIASDDATKLSIHWVDGDVSELTAATLRREARDAWSTRERIDFGEVSVAPGLTITGLAQVGPEGVNIHFSDGHDRAIFPFVYLRELCTTFDK